MIFSHRVSKNPSSVVILQIFSWIQKLLNYYANGAWTSYFQKKYSFRHYAELTRNNTKILEMSNKVPTSKHTTYMIIMVSWVMAFLTCVYKISLTFIKKMNGLQGNCCIYELTGTSSWWTMICQKSSSLFKKQYFLFMFLDRQTFFKKAMFC